MDIPAPSNSKLSIGSEMRGGMLFLGGGGASRPFILSVIQFCSLRVLICLCVLLAITEDAPKQPGAVISRVHGVAVDDNSAVVGVRRRLLFTIDNGGKRYESIASPTKGECEGGEIKSWELLERLKI